MGTARVFLILGLSLLVGLVASAPIPVAANPAAQDAGQVRLGGTLVVGTPMDPGHFNPAITTSGGTHQATGNIFNGLVALDADLNPVPDLAESWTFSPDGKTVTFTLVPGVRWHDGELFTSADVKFTFEQVLLKFHSRTKAGLENVLEGVDAPDPRTVVMRFKAPYGPLLQRLDVVEAGILPKHIYEGKDPQNDPANLQPIGTGPFKLAEYRKGDIVRMVRNESYFKPGLPYLDELVIKVVPDAGTGVLAFERGEIDVLTSTPGADVARLQASGAATVRTAGFGPGNSNCQETMFFNLRQPNLQTLEVRQAFVYAIDQQRILDQVRFGQGKVGTSPIASAIGWAYNPNVTKYPRDVAKANELLDQAGFPRGAGGTRFSVEMPFRADLGRMHEIIRENLSDVGITANIKSFEFNAAIDTIFIKREFDVGVWGYCNGPDPEVGVTRAYVSSNIKPIPFANVAEYSNPRIDELFATAATTVERDQHAAMYHEIQDILTREVPYWWLIEGDNPRTVRNEYRDLGHWNANMAERAWWEKGARPDSAVRYVVWRIVQAVPLLAGLLVFNFCLIHLAPGDPIYTLAGQSGDERYYAEMRARFGLDRPLPEQLGRYIINLVGGDFGYSFAFKQPALQVVLARVPATLLLMAPGLALATLVGIWLGVEAGRRATGWVDVSISAITLVGASMPAFWLGQLLILVFAYTLGILPVQGMSTARGGFQGVAYVLDVTRHMVLPVVTLGLLQLALITRLTRTAVADILAEEYVRTARAKGLRDGSVVYGHAVRNALLPVVTTIGGQVGTLLAGAALTEIVFAWPGLGRLLYEATLSRDYPLLMAAFLILSVAVVLANLLTDLAYAALDPRVRYH